MFHRNYSQGLSSKNKRTRQFRMAVDQLEHRELLTTTAGLGMVANPLYRLMPQATGAPSSSSLTPTQIQTAYGFNKITFGSTLGNGAGETIAIVDAYSDPNIQNDLNTFDAQFGLPDITVTQVNQNGGTSLPGTDSTGGWELEESLDVEWAHAIAPAAKIILVVANSSYDSDLLAAVTYAAAHANVVSLSWGGSEFSGETSAFYENAFIHSGVVFTVASGDSGAPTAWPSSSPNVIAVGGTSLNLGAGGTYGSESGWSGSTGGPSAYEPKPSYQNGVVTQSSTRANPDVAFNADPNTGFAVYDSFRGGGGWTQVGGTSAGAPQWAALFAIADQGRAAAGKAALNSVDPQEASKLLYAKAGTAAFHDIVTGTSTGSPHYSAGPGYDFVTGIGSPVANLLVSDLGAAVTPPATPDHLVVTASSSTTAGNAFTLTVTAQTSAGATDTAYTGTISFTSSDTQAGLPANYTFVSANHGVATFSVTLKTAGSQSVTATDTVNSAITGVTRSITVSPAAATQLILSGLSTVTTAGVSQSLTLKARDNFGNLATNYLGTLTFTSSDGSANLPSSYTFTSSDRGSHNFNVTFNTVGSKSLTVTGTNPSLATSQTGIVVSPAAPLSLTAAVVSNTQINLSWTAATGAAAYTIQRSPDGSTNWTQVGTTTGATTYQDTGLTAGTTYYYRVAATGGNLTSAYSNVANAATTGGVVTTGAANSIWSNSYIPYENAYAAGNYDVGVKFTSDVAGAVTGVRFYKQYWMDGWTHVGYLWSSNGSLLGKATFSAETINGWQQVSFATPVSIAANTVYIVSFSTGGGYFGISTGYFNRGGVNTPPLHALSNGVSGGNGVYGVSNSAFPTVNGGGMNFWADVAFSPAATGSVVKAVTGSAAAATTGLVAPSGPGSAFAASSTSNTNPTGGWSIGIGYPRRNNRPNVVANATGHHEFRSN